MKRNYLAKVPVELLFWLSALLALYWIRPSENQHFSLCPLHALGFNFCPGCGIGRSIHQVMHGNWVESFHQHKLGIIAFMVIIYRILVLFIQKFKTIEKNHNIKTN